VHRSNVVSQVPTKQRLGPHTDFNNSLHHRGQVWPLTAGHRPSSDVHANIVHVAAVQACTRRGTNDAIAGLDQSDTRFGHSDLRCG